MNLPWLTVRLGDAGEWLSGGTPSKKNAAFWTGTIPWVSPKDMKVLRIGDAIDHVSNDAIGNGTRLVPENTILMVVRGMILAHTFPVAMTTSPVAFNQDVKALRVADIFKPDFVLYWLQSEAHNVLRQTDVSNHGTRRLPTERLFAMQVPVPPFPEQRKIAAILLSVDEAIEKTEAVIEQLRVVKKAMMQELLTRGLPGRHTRFKKTEIGEVPKDWEVVKLGELARFVTSGSRGWKKYYADEGALFIRSQNVRSGFLDFTDLRHVQPPAGVEGSRTAVNSSDLLITITGNSVGNVAVVPSDWTTDAYVSQHVGLVRIGRAKLAAFAAWYFAPGAPGNAQILAAQYGQSKPGLNLTNLRNFTFPVPHEEELWSLNARLDSVQLRIHTEKTTVTSLQRAKSALMSVLLSGEVRVTPDEDAA